MIPIGVDLVGASDMLWQLLRSYMMHSANGPLAREWIGSVPAQETARSQPFRAHVYQRPRCFLRRAVQAR